MNHYQTPVTLNFTKTITTGILTGFSINETLSFVSLYRAKEWVDFIIRHPDTVGFTISNFTHKQEF